MSKFHLPLVFALTAGLALPAAAAAAPGSSFAESRGYQNCRAAAERAVALYSVDGKYYIYDRKDARQYYMNGFAHIDGASAAVKIDCLTNVSGHRVETINVATGEFVGRLVEGPVVAQTD
ncbi:MAG: hypothetical protein ACNA7W_14075 [Pseudomonadales bacterium]